MSRGWSGFERLTTDCWFVKGPIEGLTGSEKSRRRGVSEGESFGGEEGEGGTLNNSKSCEYRK